MTTGRLLPWLKISLGASSGPTPSRQPTVPGSSQLVKYFIIFFWSRSWHLLFQILFAVNKDSGAMEGYIAPYNEYYMVILSQPDHNILSWLIWNIVLLSCQWIIALQVTNIVPGCLPCQHDQLSRQQGSAAFCHLHGQVGVVANQAMSSTHIFFFLQRRRAPRCQRSPGPHHLWGLHLAHWQLQQLLHEQLHTSSTSE